MHYLSTLLLGSLSLLPAAIGYPQAQPSELGEKPAIYTLTVYKPDDPKYNGLKVQGGGNIFQEHVAGYCPDSVKEMGACPNGTETAFVGTLTPSSLVPGGQDSFVYATGQFAITVQHSHALPSGAYWSYQGFNWTGLSKNPDSNCTTMPDCPTDNAQYNCETPSGVYTWRIFYPELAPQGGIYACPNPYSPGKDSIYAWTPQFNSTGCIELDGLATHNYTGPNPPVWAY